MSYLERCPYFRGVPNQDTSSVCSMYIYIHVYATIQIDNVMCTRNRYQAQVPHLLMKPH